MALGVQNELEQKLIEFCYKNTMVIANTSSNNTRDDSTHGYHQIVNTKIRLYSLQPKMKKLFTVSKNKQTKKNLEADCGSDHELLIENFRLKLKKVEKITRSFRYDLNQILYDYSVGMTHRFKVLDLIRVLEELWTEL